MSYGELFSLLGQKIAESESSDASKKLQIVLSGSITLGDTAILDKFISTYSDRLEVKQTDGRKPTDYRDDDETAVYYVKLDSMEIYRNGEIIAQIAPQKVVMTPPPQKTAAPCYRITTALNHGPFELPRECKGTPPVADKFDQDGNQIAWRGTYQDQEHFKKSQASSAEVVSEGGAPPAP